MTAPTPSLDYAEVGLRVGLEVHQQLLTERKLFCNCPAGVYTTTHDGVVLRHMRPTLSELGQYDGTALMEFKTRKNILYLLNRANSCTYEMDDTPPFMVNSQAIDVAIEQCLVLGCDIVDEVHIARKQYLDGSIPTGFQRTAVVGMNGRLPFRGREITITQVTVEEDSCREVSDVGHLVTWRADRLGTPLIETVTGPDLHTPEEVADAILLVGRVCRGTGHVRVGLGASRQDVNVSVRGGRRVEIKGVPKAGWAVALVHGEAVRQVELLRLRDALAGRGFTEPHHVEAPHADVTELLAASTFPWFRTAHLAEVLADRRPGLERGDGRWCVRAVKLVGMRGVLSHPGQPGLCFDHELRGRIRVIAGIDYGPILVHDEAWPDYPGAGEEQSALRQALGCGPDDALAVVSGAERDTLTAAEEIRLRLVDALDGVPHETRQPFRDGHTDFERILPGPDRMYPDTDSPPHRVTVERVEALRAALPDPPWVRQERYAAAGVPEPTIHWLIRRGGANAVDLVCADGADLRFACFFFGERLKGLARRGVPVHAVPEDGWRALFALFRDQPVLVEAWKPLVSAMAAQPGAEPAVLAARLGLGRAPEGWVGDVAALARGAGPDHPDGSPAQRVRFLMGRAMPGLRGRVPAAAVRREVSDVG